MKYILIIILTAFELSATAQQFEYNRFDAIPYSKMEKFKKYINKDSINTIDIGKYNNDSLFIANNGVKKSEFRAGRSGTIFRFRIDQSFNITDIATRYTLPNGYLYMLKIKSETSESICVNINNFDIPRGSYFSSYTDDITNGLQLCNTYAYSIYPDEWYNERKIYPHARGENLILEYYQPFSVSKKPALKVNYMYYGFADLIKQQNDIKLKNNKSGAYGTSANAECQIDYFLFRVSSIAWICNPSFTYNLYC